MALGRNKDRSGVKEKGVKENKKRKFLDIRERNKGEKKKRGRKGKIEKKENKKREKN